MTETTMIAEEADMATATAEDEAEVDPTLVIEKRDAIGGTRLQLTAQVIYTKRSLPLQ